MIREILFVSILSIYPISLQIKSRLSSQSLPSPQKYKRLSIESLVILFILFLLQPDSWHHLDFDRIGRGISFNRDILSVLPTLFIVPPVMAFLPFGSLRSEIGSTDRVFGCPVEFLPVSYAGFPLFVFNLIIGVIFEELFCRQFVFYGFYHVFGIRGDWLLVISSLLFTVAHTYPRWQDYFAVLLVGLILGKLFQSYGTIVLPMILHFCLNSTVIVLAYKRIAKKN